MRHNLSFESLEDRCLLAVGPLTLEPFVSGMARPVVATHAGDSSGRLFVAEQGGQIQIVRDGQREARPFLDISAQLIGGGASGERGLLGLAFHPDYAADGADGEGKFYVYYSAPSPVGDHDSVVAEFHVSASDSDVAGVLSQRTLLRFNQPFSNHNGGDLKFGPDDGLLYISSGDGGGGGDPLSNGQDATTLLGAILRVDVSGDDFPADPLRNYRIPPSNPFVNDAAARDEIFAFGLRNPFRISLDDGPNGNASPDRLFVGDVGQSSFEEVDIVTAGGNFGWNVCEGDHRYGRAELECPAPFIPPIAEYGRDEGISVIGGFVYRGSSFPGLSGVYVFGDFNGTLMTLEEQPDGSFMRSVPAIDGNQASAIIGFGEDELGELYVLTFTDVLAIRADPGLDFGDAPIAAQSGFTKSYPTSLPDGGRHVLGSGIFLGASVDGESDGQPAAEADGDGNDEDGVRELATIVAIATSATTTSLNVIASATARLDAWIDFNRDGDWDDASEQIAVSRQVVGGANVIGFSVPQSAQPGQAFARFRLSSLGGLSPIGQAADGEVEDHALMILSGNNPASVSARIEVPISGQVEITSASDVVSVSGSQELFRAPVSSLAGLDIILTPGDDQLLLPNRALLRGVPVVIDGNDGTDTLQLVGSGHALDLTSVPDDEVQSIEIIDLAGDGPNRLIVDVDEVLNLSPTVDSLYLVHDEDDSVDYGSGWIVEQPQLADGSLIHRLRQNEALVEIVNTRPFQNPFDRHDPNRDTEPTALDALQIINALAIRWGPLEVPVSLDDPHVYVDVSGNNVLSALDALQIINQIARSNEYLGEASLPAISIPLLSENADVYFRLLEREPIDFAAELTAASATRVASFDIPNRSETERRADFSPLQPGNGLKSVLRGKHLGDSSLGDLSHGVAGQIVDDQQLLGDLVAGESIATPRPQPFDV